jgi:hypothetical protein
MIEIDRITLQSGAHRSPKEGVCFMEAVAFIACEEHSDHPLCVCPVLGAFLRSLNDNSTDQDRQLLKPYLRLVIGTSTDGYSERRGWMCVDWLARDYIPTVLDCFGKRKIAAELRKSGAIQGVESLENIRPVLDKAALAARAARAVAALAARAARAARLKKAATEIKGSIWGLLDRMVMIECSGSHRTSIDHQEERKEATVSTI